MTMGIVVVGGDATTHFTARLSMIWCFRSSGLNCGGLGWVSALVRVQFRLLLMVGKI